MKNLRNLVLAAILVVSPISTITTEQDKVDYPDNIEKEVPTDINQRIIYIISNNQLLGEVYNSENHPDINYTVKNGDSLYSIIKRYYDTGDKKLSLDYCKLLAAYNNKSNMNLIYQGEDIRLPYTMHTKDSEQPIMRDEMFDITREELIRELIRDILKYPKSPGDYIKNPRLIA